VQLAEPIQLGVAEAVAAQRDGREIESGLTEGAKAHGVSCLGRGLYADAGPG